MTKQDAIIVKPDNSVTRKSIPSDTERESKLDIILANVNDPRVPLCDVKRLIAAELVSVTRQMAGYGENVSVMEGLKIKALDSQIKALREIGKELMEADTLSKRDTVNVDGPKVKYLLDEWMQGGMDAMRQVGIDQPTINSIVRHWRDIMVGREGQIRRNLEKIEFENNKIDKK